MTVLLSLFYGATQEPHYAAENLFRLVPEDIGQGNQLRQNYLGMKTESQSPLPTTLSATSYGFKVRLRDAPEVKAANKQRIDFLRLVWHDYPGEWFEQSLNSPIEKQRRVETFRSLLGSDIALFLVDAQKLLDYKGEEERYFKT